MKALIVDDMPINLLVIKELFRMTTCKDVDTCADGNQAIALVKENDYDLILLDRRMPDPDGIAVLGALKAYWEESQKTPVPVIALTGDAHEGAEEEYLKLGFSDYVAKPVEPEKLFMACKAHLPELHVDETEEGARVTGQMQPEPFPEWLVTLGIFDLPEGLKHSGTTKNLLEGLTIFASSIERRAGDIESAFNDEDWDAYLTRVHGLKGISGMLAATKLHEMTAALEQAADDGNIAYIKEHTAPMLAYYRGIEDQLDPLFEKPDNAADGTGGDRPQITRQQIMDAYLTIHECLDFYDYNSISLILDSLSDYTLSEDETKDVIRMREALALIDRKTLLEISDTYLLDKSA